MAKKEKRQKKRKGQSAQDLIGVKTFTKYGLQTNKGAIEWETEEGVKNYTVFAAAVINKLDGWYDFINAESSIFVLVISNVSSASRTPERLAGIDLSVHQSFSAALSAAPARTCMPMGRCSGAYSFPTF